MKNRVQVYGSLSKISTRVDRTLKLEFSTQELKPEEAGVLHGLAHNEGWVLFSPTEIKPEEIEIPDFEPEFKRDKTPSQRLRGVIYVLWEQKGKPGDYDTFYKQKMESLIDFVKTKLE